MFGGLLRLRERRLAWRLIGQLAATVAVAAIPVAAVVLGLQYRDGLRYTEQSFAEIENSQLESLAQAVWVDDRDYLALSLAGLVRLPHFRFAEVRNEQGMVLASAGTAGEREALVRSFPLVREFRGDPLRIGELTVSASLRDLRAAMLHDMAFGLLFVAVVVVVFGFAVYGLVDRRITRQVEALARRARSLANYGLEHRRESLSTPRQAAPPDELGDLVRSFDEMQSSLEEAHGSLLTSEQRYRSLFDGLPVSAWEEDFSPIKARIDALRGEVDDFAAYLAAHPEFVQEAASQVRVLAVNDAAVDLHRAGDREALLQGITQTFTLSSLAAFREELLAIWEGRNRLTAEATVKTFDGNLRDVLVYWRVAAGHEATLDRIIVSLLDITDRRRAEDRLARTVVELTVSNRELQEFARIVAHDLREPVRSIVSYAQLFARQRANRDARETEEIVETVVSAAKHLDAVVRALSDYTDISAHAQQAFRTVDTAQAAARAIAALRPEVEAAGATVEIGPLPLVSGNEGWLADLFGHLFLNALKFRSPERPLRIVVTAQRDGGIWEFAVADTGIGIDPAYAEKVFGLFKRLNPNQGQAGTGAGLAICRRIVEHHGGRIWVEAAAGGGCVFRFTLQAIR